MNNILKDLVKGTKLLNELEEAQDYIDNRCEDLVDTLGELGDEYVVVVRDKAKLAEWLRWKQFEFYTTYGHFPT